MPDAGEEADDVAIVAQVQRFLIALGAAGVDDAGYAGVDEQLWTIAEWEERIGGGDGRASVVDSIARFFDSDSTRSDSINLTRADAEQLVSVADRDRV